MLHFFLHICRRSFVFKLVLTEGRVEEQMDEEEEVRLGQHLAPPTQNPGRFSNLTP